MFCAGTTPEICSSDSLSSMFVSKDACERCWCLGIQCFGSETSASSRNFPRPHQSTIVCYHLPTNIPPLNKPLFRTKPSNMDAVGNRCVLYIGLKCRTRLESRHPGESISSPKHCVYSQLAHGWNQGIQESR